MANVLEDNKRNVVCLDQTCFYPTSGGQQHDVGVLTIDGEQFQVLNVEKVGKCVLHILDKELEEKHEKCEVLG